MYDANNRLSSIDLDERAVRHRQRRERHDPSERRRAAAAHPAPLRHLQPGGLGPRPARPERGAAGAPPGLRAVAGRFPRGHPRRLRHLPQPVGVQRADGVRAQPAVLLREAGGRPESRRPCRRCRRANILTNNATGTIGGNIMDFAYSVEYSQTWSGGIQYRAHPGHDARRVVHGHLDAGRRQRDRPQHSRSRARARFRRAARFRS